uniref:Uncharacterized protein n=1 Tax=Anopheles atroparvus TaxID=41427 RepID=A0AAG5DRQ3_ANOAO
RLSIVTKPLLSSRSFPTRTLSDHLQPGKGKRTHHFGGATEQKDEKHIIAKGEKYIEANACEDRT